MTKAFLTLFLLPLLTYGNSFAQTKADYEWYLTERNGGLCNSSILLFKDSTYCMESGCEASSHFSFGKWTQKKDTIKFIPADPATYPVISRIETSKTSDKHITVIIYDSKGINITNRVTAGQYVKTAGIYSMDLDSTQTKRSDIKRANSSIMLSSLQRIFKQKIEIPTDTSTIYKIYLNISAEWNFHRNSDWNETSTFKLIKSKDKLISTVPDQIGDKGYPESTEYIRQIK